MFVFAGGTRVSAIPPATSSPPRTNATVEIVPCVRRSTPTCTLRRCNRGPSSREPLLRRCCDHDADDTRATHRIPDGLVGGIQLGLVCSNRDRDLLLFMDSTTTADLSTLVPLGVANVEGVLPRVDFPRRSVDDPRVAAVHRDLHVGERGAVRVAGHEDDTRNARLELAGPAVHSLTMNAGQTAREHERSWARAATNFFASRKV